jgi:dTDP-4-dehydrorhamnose reductase
MRVLVTGVTGQVGSALLASLGKVDTVVPAGRSLLDLTEPDRIAGALDRLAPELIVNPAAYTAVDRAEDERELAFLVNAKAPSVIARWALQRKVPLIHFSTDYVFGGQASEPWCEGDPTGPLSTYGASKLAGEMAIREIGGAHLIIRTSWVYAATGTNFLRTIARLARERKDLRVVADQIGSPTSARVIAEAVAAILVSCTGNLHQRFAEAQGCVNIAAAGETSWHGFASAIIEGLRSRKVSLAVQSILPLRTEEYPAKATRPYNSRLDLTRLRGLFRIATPTWREALEPELDRLAQDMR